MCIKTKKKKQLGMDPGTASHRLKKRYYLASQKNWTLTGVISVAQK